MLFEDMRVDQFQSFQKQARNKLLYLHAAESLEQINALPGNRLEKLDGNRKNSWSIRINKQWRICFRWSNGDAYDVEIVDYH